MKPLLIAGVDIAHLRLIDLARLADQARPFYLWTEAQFQSALDTQLSLDHLLRTASETQIATGIRACYRPVERVGLPVLFDGIGRTYTHRQACYYFFSWLIRDAPRQRLAPLIQRIVVTTQKPRAEVEIEVLTTLIIEYREVVRVFAWDAVREVILDRLEGSRRSIKGHEKESIVRTALLLAIQHYFEQHQHYGRFANVEIPARQVTIENESYDVSANLLSASGAVLQRILIAIKTRETEGGGHAYLFTRDLLSAMNAVKRSTIPSSLVIVIIARQWGTRDADNLSQIVDHLVVFNSSPGEFSAFDNDAQNRLNEFVAKVFDS